MGPFETTLVIDTSDKPKLEDGSIAFAILFGFFWLFGAGLISMGIMFMLESTLGDAAVLLMLAAYAILYIIPMIVIIKRAIRKNKEFKAKEVHGEMIVNNVNGQCIGVFKSNYSELATVNIDEMVSNNGKVTAQRGQGHLCGIWIKNTKAKINYLGQETTCGISIFTKDKNFLNLLVEANIVEEYVKPN